MEEARAINKIETNLSKEEIEVINAAYTKEVDYWKRVALEGKNEEEKKQLTNEAPSRVFLTYKDLQMLKKRLSKIKHCSEAGFQKHF